MLCGRDGNIFLEFRTKKDYFRNKTFPSHFRRFIDIGLFKDIVKEKYKEGENLDLLLDLPWNEFSKDNFNLKRAKKILDRDHYGLTDVKNRIIEKIQSKVISINRNINLNDPLKSVREKILYEMDLNVTMVIITLNYGCTFRTVILLL